MTFILIAVTINSLSVVGYNYFFVNVLSLEFVAQVQQHNNLVTVYVDSAGNIWQSAKDFLYEKEEG